MSLSYSRGVTRDITRGITRRNLLRVAGGAALAVPALSALSPDAFAESIDAVADTAAAGGLPLAVVNRSGEFNNSSVHVYIVGTRNGRPVRVTRRGKAVPIHVSDNEANGFTDYAIPLNGQGATRLSLPRMSGRIYVSLGKKLKLKVVLDGNGRPALQQPAGWVKSDPNYPVLHDCVEFTYDADGMFCNTTMVDMFSVPMSLKLTGRGQHTTGAIKNGGRANAFAAVRRADAFARLAVRDLRIIAPGHGLDAGLFPKHYFDPYTDKVWRRYAERDLRVRTNAGLYTGRVAGGRLTFRGPATLTFDKPSTRDVLFCDGSLAAPNDGIRGPVAAALGAGFNRSVLLRNSAQPTTDPSTFYDVPVTNHYAKAIHAAARNGKAYGFPFDDVGNHATYIQDLAPRQLQLTITPF